MDLGALGDIGERLIFLIPLILILVFQFFFRKQRRTPTQLMTARNLLSEIRHNQKLTGDLSTQWPAKKLKNSTWKWNKSELRNIGEDLYNTLADAYKMIEEFNREIDAAKKHKSASYMASPDTSRLKKQLEKCEEQLTEWLEQNRENKAPTSRPRGLFG